jgi:hypothetical protein
MNLGSAGKSISFFIDVPVEFTPGTKYDYSNGNTIVLSYFVEKFSGMGLPEYLRVNILEPMGLMNTYLDNLNLELRANPNQASEYYDYTDLRRGYQYYAYGNAAATTVQPGVQTGAGGMVSTAGDLVKWYTSMFVSKNVSHIISDASLAQMIEPISVTNSHPVYGCECFGLGFFMVYQAPCDLSSVENRDYIYYQGVIQASTATILMLDNWDDPTQKPYISTAIRNAVVINATEYSYQKALLDIEGSRESIFAKYGWDIYSDSWLPALNNAYYFQDTGAPYPSADSCTPASSDSDDDESGISLSAGEVVACVLIPTIFTIGTVVSDI